jgi:uncharacterized protein YfaS (alpha-2-macroglobulin family)
MIFRAPLHRLTLLVLLAFTSMPALAQTTGHTDVVVPDQFLRRWDPVTIFFPTPTGPAAAAPEDAPQKYVTVTPPPIGAWTWLDARTLQFRPAAPWPPLSQYRFSVTHGPTTTLSRLLDPTTATDPANGTDNIEGFSTLSLTFAEPLDPKALAGMLDIAISKLPGLDAALAHHLTPADFDVKTVERNAPNDAATYIIEFHTPVPDGMRVDVAIGLSPIPGLEGAVEHLSFTTATPFRPILLGCEDQRVPLTADGATYGRAAALACTSNPNPPAADGQTDNTGDQPTGQASTDQTQNTQDLTAPATGPAAQMPVTTKTTPAQGAADTPTPPATASAAAPHRVIVEFSAPPAPFDAIAARDFIRVSPAIDNLTTTLTGDELHIDGDFRTGTLYQITLEPAPLHDTAGRPLAITGASSAWLYWPAEVDNLQLATGSGVVERDGPQMIPLSGRGYTKADLRIYKIDPLDRSYWPFPATPFTTNDNDRPPAPGEDTAPFTGANDIDADGLKAQMARLGSPSLSTLTALPLTPAIPAASFGLDLSADLARIAGANAPGTYLVGIRGLEEPGTRHWMRLQVTDLSATLVEEQTSVRVFVTSLASAAPVPGARVEIDGVANNSWTTVATGTTGPDGSYDWQIDPHATAQPTRIVVTKAGDTLVIDPASPPDRYTANGWSAGQGGWLDWTSGDPSNRVPPAQTLCHLFTERPIYRPTDSVHFKAYIRNLQNGQLSPGGLTNKVQLVITGPDTDANYTYAITPDETGNFHYLFDAKTTATGPYRAELDIDGTECAVAGFIKDAYRLPKFQIRMNGPDQVPLDKPADLSMTATYYAGGPAAARPVRWRITSFPYSFAPAARPGFIYATSALYQPDFGNQSTAALESQSTTDKEGRATVTLDPTRDPTNAPRRYVVEATVTGDDNKTVTNTQDVLALPSFVLAMHAPRYLPQASAIPLDILMVDAKGIPVAGRPITLTLLRRNWSSILQASDFSNGKPKYETQVVDEKLITRTVMSGADVTSLSLPIDRAGVYIVQLQAADALGRLQKISLDLFAAGDNPVTWSRPPATVFKVSTDKVSYVPGDIAQLTLQSPFQTGRALAIAELPSGINAYQWVDVKNGFATYPLLITPDFVPRIPVHFVLMRGRLAGDPAIGPDMLDLRRPETIAATAWIGVKPVKNIVTVAVTAPPEALPGATVDLTVKLSDDTGKPIPGEVTLWLIDQAVLALAKEAPLNPLPHFIRDRGSRVAFSDTRNWPFGDLPLDENPGGDVGAGDQNLLNRVTIRKNFNPMPYYNPALMIGPSGTATVQVKLPDDLTVFRIRAVAVSGPSRFGFATGQLPVRLPVIVEPNLPRFVRPGDSFALAGIGRVVEGPGGAGAAQVAVAGLTLSGPTVQTFTWAPNTPQTFTFPVTVPSPGYTPDGKLAATHATVTLAVERDSDHAKDAFSVDLPIEPDRDPIDQHLLVDLTSATPLSLPGITSDARPGTVRRQLIVSSAPALVRLYAGLDYLRAYPFGCTEQRIALARAELATKTFSAALAQGDDDRITTDVNATLAWIDTASAPSGLVGFWPGDAGNVVLTAWALDFLTEAQHAGFGIDATRRAAMIHALTVSLRSNSAPSIGVDAASARAWALAALANAGSPDRDYADELARERDQLTLEGLAQVSLALQAGGAANAPLEPALTQALFQGVIIKQRDGKPVYGGLQQGMLTTVSSEIFPSETRTLAEILRATAATPDPRRQIIAGALIALGQSDGWGSTNANAEALLALTAYLKGNTASPGSVALAGPSGTQTIALTSAAPVQKRDFLSGTALTLTATTATASAPIAVQDELTWLPIADGSTVAPVANGFVVTAQSNLITANGAPPARTTLAKAGMVLAYRLGEVVEDHIQLINPSDRHYVALTVPLAAGMEPLDPSLLTAPPEATPSAPPTLAPSYTAFLDDKVTYFYDTLPAGTYDFYFRTKASVPGRFIQPAASAVMMYNGAVSGGGAGALVTISP